MLTGNPVFHLESDLGVTFDQQTSQVSSWADQAAFGNNVASGGDARPVFGAVQTPTGIDAVSFDGIDDRLIRTLEDGAIAGLPDGNSDRTMFVVARYHDASAFAGVAYGRYGRLLTFGAGVPGPGHEEGQLGIQLWGVSIDTVSESSAYDPNSGLSDGWFVLSVVHQDDGSDSADNEFLYRDGTLIASSDARINTKIDVNSKLNGLSRSRIVLGEEIRELGHAQMDIAAWIVYDEALSSTERAAIESDLAVKYISGPVPTAGDDSVTVEDGGATTIDVLDNDTSPNGPIDPTTVVIVDAPQHATDYSVNPTTGEISYTHDGTGLPDSLTYTVMDTSGKVSNVATVTINLPLPNQAPTAVDDTVEIDDGVLTTINVLSNDFDTDGSVDPTSVVIIDAPQHATSYSVDPLTGEISYTHNGTGNSDTLTYTVLDNEGLVSNVATVTIEVVTTNLAPVAQYIETFVVDGGVKNINLLLNDYDLDGAIDPTTVEIIDAPSHAANLIVNPITGELTYLHDGSGMDDTFTYTVRDNLGRLAEPAAVTVRVSPDPLSLEGFSDEVVFSPVNGIVQPIATEFLPDGRMLILQKNGVIWIADPNTQVKSVYMTLNNIYTGGETGLLDIAIDPDFDADTPGEDYIYLYYTPASPRLARVSRFAHTENDGGLTSQGDLESELKLWEDTETYLACCHYGGGLDFGPDGKLWLSTSDKFTAPNPGEGGTNENLPQDLTSAGGKVIRMNSDGTVPDGLDGWPANPFIDPVDDDPALPGNQDYHDYIWAYGLRNPFRGSWDIESGRFFLGEVGGNVQEISHEDIHVATLDQPGVNFGWPNYEGPGILVHGDPMDHVRPIYSRPHNGQGASITGGEVYRGDMFPAEWQGVYFFGDFTRDFIHYLTFDQDGNVNGEFSFKPTAELPGNTNQVTSISVGSDGALYYTLLSGAVHRVTHDSANQAPSIDSVDISPLVGDAPLEVSFSADVSDAEMDVLTYEWHFGDGQTATGAVVDGVAAIDHTYATNGEYQAFVEIADGNRTVYSNFVTVIVGEGNLAPVVELFTADPLTGDAPLDVTFDAQVSDPESDDMTYRVVFGDGNNSGWLPVPVNGTILVAHTYADDGIFNAVLEVSDGSHTTNSSALQIIAGESILVPVTEGLVTLLESDIKLSVVSDTTVAAWLDGSGLGNNLDAFGDPQVVFNATPGGQPAIVFDGDGDKLERSAAAEINGLPEGSEDRTVFSVINYIDPQGITAGFAYGNGTFNQTFGLAAHPSTGQLMVQGWGGANDFTSTTPGVGAGWLVQSAKLDSNALSHYSNSQLIDVDLHAFNTVTNAANSKIVIGQEIKQFGYSQLEVAAVVVYDRALSDAERMQVETYLYQKYIVGNLPPVADDDSALVAAGSSISIDVVANDTDADGIINPATVTIVDQPVVGILEVDPVTGVVTYTHDGSGVLSDSFTYTVDDEVNVTSNIATVTVTVDDGSASSQLPVSDGLVVDLNAESGVSTSGGNVTGWLDSSGNGNDLQNATGDAQLAIAATPSGASAISFDGNDSLSREGSVDPLNAVVTGNGDRTIYFVARYNSASVSGGFAYGGIGGNEQFRLGISSSNGNLAIGAGGAGNELVSDALGLNSIWVVQSVVVSDGIYRHYRNGVLIDTGFHTFSTLDDRLAIGEAISGELGIEIDVAALLMYDRALSESERQATDAYLYNQYLASA